jgi:hypothetical protein
MVMSDLAQSAMQLCAARHDETVDYDAFTNLVYDLVDKARHEERELAAKAGPPPSREPLVRATRMLTPADRDEIRRRLVSAPRSPSGDLRRGWKQSIGADLGLTKVQVGLVLKEVSQAKR